MRLSQTSLVLLALLSACSGVEVDVADDSSTSATSISVTSPASPVATNGSPAPTITTTPTITSAPTITSVPTTSPTERPLPGDATELAADLTETERAVRNPDVDDVAARQWGARLQRLYRLLSANRAWADTTIAAVEVDVRPDVELNWAARQDLSALVNSTTLSSTLPAWRLREPLPAEELLGYYREAEVQTGVPWEILAAINLIETRMGRIEGYSTAGAVGPMQFLPATWNECCQGDPALDRDAIIGAGRYLDQRGAASDLDRALFGYNNSERYVRAVRAYASVMQRDPLAYRGYHAFEVYFLSSAGLIRMPPGYEEPEPVDAASWLADHPDALVD